MDDCAILKLNSNHATSSHPPEIEASDGRLTRAVKVTGVKTPSCNIYRQKRPRPLTVKISDKNEN